MQSLDEAVEMNELLVAVQHHRINSLDVVPADATLPQGLASRRVVYTPLLLGIKVPIDGKVPSSLRLRENRALSNSSIVRNPEAELKGSSSHTDAVLSWGVVSDMLDGGVWYSSPGPDTFTLSEDIFIQAVVNILRVANQK